MGVRILLIIGLGGFLGTVSRYLAQQVITRWLPSVFPYGTFFVNVAGCFLIGIVFAVAERSSALSPEWRVFLATGFCGGFTTFSTFSYEAIQLMREGQYLFLSLYLGLSVLMGMLATFLAIALIRAL